jgi:hypothetical protein
MNEGKKHTAWCMLFLEPFWSRLFSRASTSKCPRNVSRSGPEAAMVAAAKHFSSAHKVRFG